jgi:glycosyltransferase involved in cell wall biosynthesis
MSFTTSIIIPCYNAEKWITICVESALNQTYEDVEVIVVDNESTDKTRDKLIKLQEKYDKLVISTEPNLYPNCWDEARKKGFSLSTGDYLFTLASDDFLQKDYVTNCMKYISLHPDKIYAMQSPILNVTELGDGRGHIAHSYLSIDEFKKQCLQRCPVNSPTVVYNRKLYDRGHLETFPEVFGGAADYDLYCRLADKGVLIWPINNFLGYCYRWHVDQATWSVQQEGINYDKMIQTYWGEMWKT